MDTLIEPLTRSPRLPLLLQELSGFVAQEAQRRQRFYDEMSEEHKMEFINGEVVVQSPAKLKHLDATHHLLRLIGTYVTVHALGKVCSEKALVCLTRNDYEPDIVFFGPAKAATLEPNQMKFPAPDLVVEVLSSSTQQVDRGVKFEDYAAHGVAEYWIVDADAGSVEQYVLGAGGGYELTARAGGAEIHSAVIRGLAIPVRAIFDEQENLRVLRAVLA